MPYTSNNWTLFSIYSDSRWWKKRQCEELVIRLNRVNFSVVASRQDGLDAINNFLDTSMWGDSLFGVAKRFPNEIGDNYLTTGYGLLGNVLNDLQSSLSWRPTNKAKDTEATRGGAGPRGRDSEQEMLDQGCQDQTKAFSEQRKLLAQIIHDKEEVFRQVQFELRTASNWSDGGAAGGAGLPDGDGEANEE